MGDKDERIAHVVAVAGWQATGLLPAQNASSANNSVPHVGSLVKMRTPHGEVFGLISRMRMVDLTATSACSALLMEIEALGEKRHPSPASPEHGFERGVSTMPCIGADILLPSEQDLAHLYGISGEAAVPVGVVHNSGSQTAALAVDRLLGKHFAILGTTGAGKSCAVAVIVHSLLGAYPNGHIVMLDPHNEYASAFGNSAALLNPATMRLPYWLMNFEETASTFASACGDTREYEIHILRDLVLAARLRYAQANGSRIDTIRRATVIPGDVSQFTVDTPVPYYLTELLDTIEQSMGRLEQPGGLLPYLRLKSKIEGMLADRRFAFMFGGDIVGDSLAEFMSNLLRLPVAGKPVTIIDLSGIPTEIVNIVVSLIARLMFDFAVWSCEPHAAPSLLICEEAHRYINRDEAAGSLPARRAISRIALEGRKYGISLGLVSQRPSELAPTTLAQCNTIFALRMSNELDQQFVRNALPEGADALVATLPALRTGEAIVAGEAVPLPIRLQFADLDASRRPRSATAPFAEAWRQDGIDDRIVQTTVERWRRQRRNV
jgi:hypothetical protein